MNRRGPLLFALIALIAVAGGIYWMLDSGGGRTDRRGEGARSRGSADPGGEAARADDGARADAAAIAKMIERYGGFETKGRVFLTRPTEPAEDLDVVLAAEIDGQAVEARAKSDSEGRFALMRLPRAPGYRLSVTGERAQALEQDLPEPAGDLDLGDLYLDRWYVLKGKVVSSAGVAVPRAEVAIVVPNGGSEGFSWADRMKSAGEKDPVAAAVETGNDGRFLLKLKDPGVFHVRARAKDWAPHYKDDVFVGAGADTELRIALTRGVEIGGIVLDAAGRPLPDAAVSLFPNSRNWWSQVKELDKTGRDGRFGFRIEPRSDRYQILVSPPGGVDVNKRFALPLTEELVVRLPGGATLKGRVVDAGTSQPVANAEILVSLKGPGATPMQGAYQKALRTDAYGIFRLEGVGTDGLQSLAVSAEGYAHFVGSAWSRDPAWTAMTRITFTAGQEVQLPDVPLKRGRLVEGTVRDAETGRPIEGAEVTLRDMVVGNRTVETGADGRYRFGDIGDRASILAWADGYVDAANGGFWGEQLPADQGVVRRDFELERAGRVSGTVKTADGAPVARALVRLRAAEQGRGAFMTDIRLRDHFTHTDGQGRYAIDGVPPVRLKATASTPGFETGESEAKEIESGAEIAGLDVKLVSSASIAGLVTARGGGLVPNARITIAKDPGADDVGAQWRSLAEGTVAFSDGKGRFSAEDVPSGDLLLRVEAEGFATETVRRKGVEPGADVKGVTVTLPPALEITGTVVDENGEPMARAWVRARRTDEADAQLIGARVDADGSFELRNLAEGTYTLEVNTWGGGGTQYERLVREGVAAGAADLLLQLKVREQ